MIQFLKELYLTGFVIGFRIRMPQQLGGGWRPTVDAGKGVAVISMIVLLVLSSFESWIEIYLGKTFSFHSNGWMSGAIALAFYFANYYVLVARGYGTRFERKEFFNLNKSRKILLLVSFALLLLATMTFVGFSVSAYQRFFHIVRHN